MLKLIIASRNLHKIREMRTILKEIPDLDVLSLLDYPDYVAPPESGNSFKENASTKAIEAAKALGSLVLADDSGIVVPALSGNPGIFSARYSGEKASDAENRHKLLQEMEHLIDTKRYAYYECAMALASPDGLIKVAEGSCDGYITKEEKGSQGFGYDSIFRKHEYSKTFAELEESTKNRVSHRRKALDKVMLSLQSLSHR